MLLGWVRGVEKVLVLRIGGFAGVVPLGTVTKSLSPNNLKAVSPNRTEFGVVGFSMFAVETDPVVWTKREVGVDQRVVIPMGVGGGVVKTNWGVVSIGLSDLLALSELPESSVRFGACGACTGCFQAGVASASYSLRKWRLRRMILSPVRTRYSRRFNPKSKISPVLSHFFVMGF